MHSMQVAEIIVIRSAIYGALLAGSTSKASCKDHVLATIRCYDSIQDNIFLSSH